MEIFCVKNMFYNLFYFLHRIINSVLMNNNGMYGNIGFYIYGNIA